MSVFISHSSRNDHFVNQLIAEMHVHRLKTWVDHLDIPPGRRWVEMVGQALDHSYAMVLVWSRFALASKHVQLEWQTFIDMGRPIFPVALDDCPLPVILRTVQRLDFKVQEDYTAQLAQLLKAVKQPAGTTQTVLAVDTTPPTPVQMDDSLRQTGALSPLVSMNTELAALQHQVNRMLGNNPEKPAQREVQIAFPASEKFHTYSLENPLFIGRSHKDTAAKPDIDTAPHDIHGTVSRQHAMIAQTSEGIHIIDLWSRNGTFVGGKQLDAKEPYKINDGDIIFLSRRFPIYIRHSSNK